MITAGRMPKVAWTIVSNINATMMIKFKQISLFALLALTMTGTVSAQDTMRTYIFGHSLINHELQVNPTPSQETSVPHWFHFLSEETNKHYEVSGQYGFIPQHATNLPPTAQWGFDSVAGAWDDWLEPFSDADFSNILITPGNFMQWQPPHFPYWNDSVSPIGYTNTVFNWVNQQEDSLNLYIYENWPDMAGFLNNGFPPNQTEWNDYNTYLNGGFHDWFLAYHDSVRLAHPNHCVRMIPTGPVISSLLATSPFDQIAIDTLYEDDAPHGRPTIYFLAALVTYMAMHEEMAPMSYQVPAIIDPIIANNYPTAVNFIWNELLQFNDTQNRSRVFCDAPVLLAIGEEQQEENFVEEALIEEDFVVFPNPIGFGSTSGLLQVRSGIESYDLSIVDLRGRQLKMFANSPQAIDLSELSQGMYLARMRNLKTGEVYTKRIVIGE